MFIFTVCQLGAEAALKKEIATHYADFKFAYSRPGFLTFKYGGSKALDPGFELRTIFARAYGLSIGKASSPSEVFTHVRNLASELGESWKKPRLHVWERDQHIAGEEPKDFSAGVTRTQALEEIRRSPEFRQLFLEEEKASPDDFVLDLIFLEPGSWWIGFHRHSSHHSPFAGGNPHLNLPEKAPSRAYLKLEEALTWSNAPIRKGDIAVEIGSAPGGASYALLQRGLNVFGIDPADMAPSVSGFGPSRFEHLRQTAAQTQRSDLPDAVQWILLDMNVAPVISLNTVERIAPWYASSLLGMILTLKINEWKYADEIPKLLKRVGKLEMVRIRATQLASNKQEICVFALTRKGIARGR
jgi:23S rRNA (cytidine2498-2'-O)-methyltransferase